VEIDKAIEILTHYDTDLDKWNEEDNQAAVRLGIEALRYVKWLHEIKLLAASTKLPGETKTKVIRL